MSLFKARPEQPVNQHGMPLTGSFENDYYEKKLAQLLSENQKEFVDLIWGPDLELSNKTVSKEAEEALDKAIDELRVLSTEEIEKRNAVPAWIGNEQVLHKKTVEKFKKSKKENK